MSLRSGKQVGFDPQPSNSRSNEVEELIIEEEEQSTPTARVETSLPQAPKAHKPSNSANKGKEVPILINSNAVPPNVPFPHRFMQSKKEEAEKDILETFKKVQVNIPLLDAITQVPRYAKFLKELCTTRKRISSNEVVKDHFEQLNDDALELVIAQGMDIQNNEASPTLELKPLPSQLKYVFLSDDETLLVIISSTLTAQEEDKLKSGVTVVTNAENELVPTRI
ncbi:hypothetical protein ACFX10_015051 [Malus domestica]